MSSVVVDIVGSIAAFLTTVCWLPQTVRIIRTKETSAISFASQAIFASGVTLWLAYGFMISSWPIIAANFITLLLLIVIIFLKLKHG
jgi:MtN3 and saliva related transmembrane protein